VTCVISFGVSVTVDYAIVLDSKGIREAVQENNPIKALNSFAFRDTFDGVDTPLVVFEASITAAAEVSAAIVKIGVSGGLRFVITFDFYDPNPATSGGLIRPFEMVCISPNPLDWFEVTISAFVKLSFYIQVGLFLGFFEIVLFEYRLGVEFPLFDPIKITPKLPGRVANIDPAGIVTIDFTPSTGSVTCKHIDGGSGDEKVQCWQTDKNNPMINYLEKVSSLAINPSSLRRRLSGGTTNTMTLSCIMSSFDISSIVKVKLDYEQCSLYGGQLKISGNKVTGTEGPLTFSNTALERGEIILPQPAQDFLVTSIGDECNAEWTLSGDTALILMVGTMGSDCMVKALGYKQESVLTVDLSSTDCVTQNVTIDLADGSEPRGRVYKGTILHAQFNSTLYNDIVIQDITEDCNNYIRVKKTSLTLKSVSINTFGGNDTIEIGQQGQPYEYFIHASVIIDGGDGLGDRIIIHDGSNKMKNQTVFSTSLVGFQKVGRNNTFSYRKSEYMEINLGNFVDLNVDATADNFHLTISYNNSNSNYIRSSSTSGPLNIFSYGQSMDAITVNKNRGGVFVQTSGGDKTMTVDTVEGDLRIAFDNTGNDRIEARNVKGDQTIATSAGHDTIIVHSVNEDTLLTILGGETNNIVINDLLEANAVIQGGNGDDIVIINNATEASTTFAVSSGVKSRFLNVTTLSGRDSLQITTTATCTMAIDTGADNDFIEIFGLGFGTNGTVLGGSGSDTLTIDGRDYASPILRNLMDGSTLNWNGGADEDIVIINLTSAGNTNFNLFGDSSMKNYMELNCPDVACVILSRDTFLANM
jgi:hypothetical protein